MLGDEELVGNGVERGDKIRVDGEAIFFAVTGRASPAVALERLVQEDFSPLGDNQGNARRRPLRFCRRGQGIKQATDRPRFSAVAASARQHTSSSQRPQCASDKAVRAGVAD